MPNIYVNVHIPKNGGMTFDSILARLFGRGFARISERQPGHILTAAEKTTFLQNNPQVRCISSHNFRYPAPALPGAKYEYLTFLREPVARLVSLYAYERQLTADNLQHGSQHSIEAWIDYRLAEDQALTNGQAFHLTGAADPHQADLTAARPLLDEFTVVGVTDEFDDSLIVMGVRLGLRPYDLAYQKQNVTASKERFPVDARTRQRLQDLNKFDTELYEAARHRLAQSLSAMRPGQLDAWRTALNRAKALAPTQYPWTYRVAARLRRWRGGFTQ